jgi:transcriptional regulator with XRE-family HTH domain
VIHFGHYIRGKRVAKGWTIRKFSAVTGITEVRLIAYEKQAAPVMYDSTFGKLALALGVTPEELDRGWRTTEVEEPQERTAPKGRGTIRIKLTPYEHEVLTAYAEGVESPPAEAAKLLMLESLKTKKEWVKATGERKSRGATSRTGSGEPGSSRSSGSRTEGEAGTSPPPPEHTDGESSASRRGRKTA